MAGRCRGIRQREVKTRESVYLYTQPSLYPFCKSMVLNLVHIHMASTMPWPLAERNRCFQKADMVAYSERGGAREKTWYARYMQITYMPTSVCVSTLYQNQRHYYLPVTRIGGFILLRVKYRLYSRSPVIFHARRGGRRRGGGNQRKRRREMYSRRMIMNENKKLHFPMLSLPMYVRSPHGHTALSGPRAACCLQQCDFEGPRRRVSGDNACL
jgi:hypothetical protein